MYKRAGVAPFWGNEVSTRSQWILAELALKTSKPVRKMRHPKRNDVERQDVEESAQSMKDRGAMDGDGFVLCQDCDCENFGDDGCKCDCHSVEEDEDGQEDDDEWCEEHEQIMWKDGLKCSGCLAKN